MAMSSFLLFGGLLLSLSIHACSGGRHLYGIVHKDSGRVVHHSIKDVETAKFEKTLIPAVPTPVQYLGGGGEITTVDGSLGGASTEKQLNSEGFSRDMEEARRRISGAVRTESLATVSWRVPREKHDEHPGFNLDYSPPKTHPPSHN